MFISPPLFIGFGGSTPLHVIQGYGEDPQEKPRFPFGDVVPGSPFIFTMTIVLLLLGFTLAVVVGTSGGYWLTRGKRGFGFHWAYVGIRDEKEKCWWTGVGGTVLTIGGSQYDIQSICGGKKGITWTVSSGKGQVEGLGVWNKMEARQYQLESIDQVFLEGEVALCANKKHEIFTCNVHGQESCDVISDQCKSKITSCCLVKGGIFLGCESGETFIFRKSSTLSNEHIKVTLNSGHHQPVSTLHKDKIGRVYSGCHGGLICSWENDIISERMDVSSKNPRCIFKAHSSEVTCIITDLEAGLLISGSKNGIVKLWDLETYKELMIIKGNRILESIENGSLETISMKSNINVKSPGTSISSIHLYRTRRTFASTTHVLIIAGSNERIELFEVTISLEDRTGTAISNINNISRRGSQSGLSNSMTMTPVGGSGSMSNVVPSTSFPTAPTTPIASLAVRGRHMSTIRQPGCISFAVNGSIVIGARRVAQMKNGSIPKRKPLSLFSFLPPFTSFLFSSSISSFNYSSSFYSPSSSSALSLENTDLEFLQSDKLDWWWEIWMVDLLNEGRESKVIRTIRLGKDELNGGGTLDVVWAKGLHDGETNGNHSDSSQLTWKTLIPDFLQTLFSSDDKEGVTVRSEGHKSTFKLFSKPGIRPPKVVWNSNYMKPHCISKLAHIICKRDHDAGESKDINLKCNGMHKDYHQSADLYNKDIQNGFNADYDSLREDNVIKENDGFNNNNNNNNYYASSSSRSSRDEVEDYDEDEYEDDDGDDEDDDDEGNNDYDDSDGNNEDLENQNGKDDDDDGDILPVLSIRSISAAEWGIACDFGNCVKIVIFDKNGKMLNDHTKSSLGMGGNDTDNDRSFDYVQNSSHRIIASKMD